MNMDELMPLGVDSAGGQVIFRGQVIGHFGVNGPVLTEEGQALVEEARAAMQPAEVPAPAPAPAPRAPRAPKAPDPE